MSDLIVKDCERDGFYLDGDGVSFNFKEILAVTDLKRIPEPERYYTGKISTRIAFPKPFETVYVAGGKAYWTSAMWISVETDKEIEGDVLWWQPMEY